MAAPLPSDGVLHGMSGSWVIVNQASGSHDPAQCEAVGETLQRQEGAPATFISIPDDPMPSAADAAGVGRIVIFAGDGTVNAAVKALDGWQGDLIVLPGGTMNLLSRKLHGDRKPLAILSDALRPDMKTRRLPVAEGHGLWSLVGIVAGATAAWGDVREDMRKVDIVGLVESVPQALQETLQGDPVFLDGVEGEFQAIFIDPEESGLRASAILAATPAELLQHGWAWLRGDFREGPQAPLLSARSLILRRRGDFSLLVDGEQAEVESPCRFEWGQCGLNFVATRAA